MEPVLAAYYLFITFPRAVLLIHEAGASANIPDKL